MLSKRLWPKISRQLKSKINFRGRCTNAAKTIILIPKAQITIKFKVLKYTSKYQAKFTMVSSIKTNQRPRLNKKADSSLFVFLRPAINAESPARKLKPGAQKCVIHLVKNSGRD